MPDKTRKIQVCFPIELNSPLLVVKTAIDQLNKRITLVRIAVARFELTSVTPIFAKIAVIPANSAERSAQINHCMRHGYRGQILCLALSSPKKTHACERSACGDCRMGSGVWTFAGAGMLRRSKIFIVTGLNHAI